MASTVTDAPTRTGNRSISARAIRPVTPLPRARPVAMARATRGATAIVTRIVPTTVVQSWPVQGNAPSVPFETLRALVAARPKHE